MKKAKKNFLNRYLKIDMYRIFILLIILTSCSKKSSQADPNPNPQPGQTTVKGSVKDASGNPYPKSLVIVYKGSDSQQVRTDAQGNFSVIPKGIGDYEVNLVLPLATKSITSLPALVNVQQNKVTSIDLIIKPDTLKPVFNFGAADIFGEIRDIDGKIPANANDLIYARNVFDAPLGLLTAIKAPDNHHVTLSEWQKAKGTLFVKCTGTSSTVEISLQGMIPNGTYTLWCNFLNKQKKVGESIQPASDLVKIEPLGSGTSNIVVAGAGGTINSSIQHPSCILTEEAGLVLVIIYHINGKTFGSAHIPDEEEVAHMLTYFQ